MKDNYLIEGSRSYEAIFVYHATIAGNNRPQFCNKLDCKNIEDINVHKYRVNIFNSTYKKVLDLINSIVEFNRISGKYMQRIYPLNDTLNKRRVYEEILKLS